MTLEDRLWKYISPEPNSGCWLWAGADDGRGYGVFRAKGKAQKAHRIVYEQYAGHIPDGMSLDHLCRIKCCVNPSHLEPVTHAENCRRGVAAVRNGALQRAKTHCPQGHPYAGENLYVRSNGRRGCRICRRNAVRKYTAKKREAKSAE